MGDGYTLEAIRPLIREAEVDGRSLNVRFRCSKTGQIANAHWSAAPVGVSAAIAEARTRPLYQFRAQVNGLVRGFLGYGALARVSRKLSDAVLADRTQLTTDQEELGLIAAFRSVSSQFAWVEGRWVHASYVGQEPDLLSTTLLAAPELSSYEREVTARMLVAVALATGEISDEERLHLGEALGSNLSIESLLNKPALTPSELMQTNHQVRGTMLAIAWSMAFCDELYDHREEAVIDDLGKKLGVPLEERVEAKRLAQLFVLDSFVEQVFAWGDYDQAARDRFYALAEQIGVAQGAAERAEARCQKRHLA